MVLPRDYHESSRSSDDAIHLCISLQIVLDIQRSIMRFSLGYTVPATIITVRFTNKSISYQTCLQEVTTSQPVMLSWPYYGNSLNIYLEHGGLREDGKPDGRVGTGRK